LAGGGWRKLHNELEEAGENCIMSWRRLEKTA
jgi:hypothetical protein